MKKTIKSSMKKYQTGGRTAQNSAGSGRVPTVPAKKPVNKTVTKGNGKVTVSYKGADEQTTATRLFGTSGYPTTIKKVYDNKGNLITATKTVKGNYGSSVSTPIKTKPTTKPVNKPGTSTKPTTPKPKTPTKTLDVYAPKPKPATKTPAKPAASGKTVSQLWTEKTGLPWSEAKKQGMSDGSAASNTALMKKLQTGKPMEYISSGYKIPAEDEARAIDAAYDAANGGPKTTMRRGGSVKRKMKSKKK
jgi:hypothetical protein